MGTVKLLRMTGRRKQREGFTLLELLVVVGILATLVALALPYYQDYINQSRITASQADLTSFAKALALYEQTETTYTAENNFTPLIGKYIQDFRTYSGQLCPKDPWGNDYVLKPIYGSVVCCGINGVDETTTATATARLAQGDDSCMTYKPPFFVTSARAINATMIEVVFSRRVESTLVTLNSQLVAAGSSGVTAAAGAPQRVSETIYRVKVNAMSSPPAQRSITVAASVKDVTGMPMGTDDNPAGGDGEVATFKY